MEKYDFVAVVLAVSFVLVFIGVLRFVLYQSIFCFVLGVVLYLVSMAALDYEKKEKTGVK